MGCGDECVKYQDIVVIEAGTGIDSIAVKINGSDVGCEGIVSKLIIGSKIHSVKFPREMHVQLFSEGVLLWEDSSFEMPKNMRLSFYRGTECEGNPFINSSLTDNYCWLVEKFDDENDVRCIELAVGGPIDRCK
jgi:hypothetical protein